MADSQPPLVLLDRPRPGVARITFNRPEKRNAMNREARRQLIEALQSLRSEAKVVMLTGSGPAFCSGVDLKEVSAGDTALDGDSPWIQVQETIRRHPAVVISAVNGFALGGGATLINTSDLAVAADEAQIGMPEVTFGLYPGLAGPSTQLRLSQKRAAWLVLTGERIDGRRAAEWGMVNESVPLERLTERTLEIAERIAAFDRVALEWCKRALWEVPMHIDDWTAALEYGEGVGTHIRSRSGAIQDGLSKYGGGVSSDA